MYAHHEHEPTGIWSVESQKGTIIIQRCSIENQKGTINIQSDVPLRTRRALSL